MLLVTSHNKNNQPHEVVVKIPILFEKQTDL